MCTLTEIRALHHLQVTHTPERTCWYLRLRDVVKPRAFLLILHHHRHQVSDVNIFTEIPESSLLERKSRGQEEGCGQQHRYHDDRCHGCWKRKMGSARLQKMKTNWWQWFCTVSLIPSFLLFVLIFIFFLLCCSTFFLSCLYHNSLVFSDLLLSRFSFFIILSNFLTFPYFLILSHFLSIIIPSFQAFLFYYP